MNILKTLLSYVILTFVLCVFAGCLTITLVGCGHTVYHKVEGTGVYGRIPTPNGSSLVEVAIGDLAITSGMLRGGATYDENTSKGGTFGSVSMGRHVYLSTEPAMNEGYIESVLTSKDTDSKTKQLLAEYLISRQSKVAQPSTTTSVNSATATGNTPPEAKPTRTGTDHVVEKVAETTPKIVAPVATATKSVVKDMTSTVKEVSDDWKQIVFIVCILVALFGIPIIYGLIVYIKKKKQSKSKSDDLPEKQVTQNDVTNS